MFKKLSQNVRAMPLAVTLFFGFFALMPVWAILSFDLGLAHWSEWSWKLGLDYAALIVVPWALAGAIFLRHKVAIPLYFAECLAIFVYSFIYLEGDGYVNLVRSLLILLSLCGGLFILSRDHLYPLLALDNRLWRRSRRLVTERLVRVRLGTEAPQITAVLKNCSERGVCLAGLNDEFDSLSETSKNQTVQVELTINGSLHNMDMIHRWTAHRTDQVLVGLESKRASDMAPVLDQAADAEAAHGVIDAALKLLARTEVKRFLITSWCLSLVLSVGFPSCGRMETEQQHLRAASHLADDAQGQDRNVIGAYHTTTISAKNGSTEFGLLAAPSDIIVDIDGCISGFKKLFTLAAQSDTINLVSHDVGCRVELIQFQSGEESFVLAPGHTFDLREGASNPFIGTSGGRRDVLVSQQLEDDVRPDNDQVEFIVIETEEGGPVSTGLLDIVLVFAEPVTTEVEEGSDSVITYRLTRQGPKDQPLDIAFALGGTAEADSDYRVDSTSIRMPGGADQVDLDIVLIDDRQSEEDEVLTLTLLADEDYTPIGEPSVVMITDDDESIIPTEELVIRYGPETILATNSGKVYEWSDMSPAANHAEQSEKKKRPRLRSNYLGGQDAIKFDGRNDVLKVRNDDEINSGGPYDGKTYFVTFETGPDVERRQIIWEQGGRARGINLYIDEGDLYFHAYNRPDDGPGSNWDPVFINYPLEPNRVYVATFILDSDSHTIHGYVNGRPAGVDSRVDMLFRHGGKVGLGGVNGWTRFHDESIDSDDAYFEGVVGEFIKYNRALETQEIRLAHFHLLDKYMMDAPFLSVEAADTDLTEGVGASTTLTFRRDMVSRHPVTVHFEIEGSATEGDDFQTMVRQVTIPSHQLETSIPLIVLDDEEEESTESIEVTILEREEYHIESGSVELTLHDDDRFLPTGSVAMWLRSDRGITHSYGDRVRRWEDDTDGRSIEAYQSSISRQPSLRQDAIGDQSALVFDGYSDYLTIDNNAALNIGRPYESKTLALVFKTDWNVSSRQVLFQQSGGSRGLTVYIERGRLYLTGWNSSHNRWDRDRRRGRWRRGGHGETYMSARVESRTSYAVVVEFDFAEDEMRGTLNGQSMGVVRGVDELFHHTGRITIGSVRQKTYFHDFSYRTSGSHFKGAIGEVLFINDILSTPSKGALEDYFTDRYDL